MDKNKREKIVATDDTIHGIVYKEISKLGKDADLNHIDVSNVTNMGYLFGQSKFNGDISKWDVSKVTRMDNMFYKSEFNGDISKWNVSKLTNMSHMFYYSIFNSDISKWDVSEVTNMAHLFNQSKFNGDISKWDVSKVTRMDDMFYDSKFNGDISKWKLNINNDMDNRDPLTWIFRNFHPNKKPEAAYNSFEFQYEISVNGDEVDSGYIYGDLSRLGVEATLDKLYEESEHKNSKNWSAWISAFLRPEEYSNKVLDDIIRHGQNNGTDPWDEDEDNTSIEVQWDKYVSND